MVQLGYYRFSRSNSSSSVQIDYIESFPGGGGVLPYVCILGMCRARDPHFQPWMSVPEHIIFKTYQSVLEHHHFTFLADFAVPETIIFKISLISTRSSPPTAGSARTQSVWQRRGLAAGQSASQTRPGSSGDWHFHAQTGQARSGAPHFHAHNGSSLFRSPAFSRSTGPISHFAAAHSYKNLGWVPPPPPPGVVQFRPNLNAHWDQSSN